MAQDTSVIWDWNGTLLNDTDLCIDIMNGMLTHKGLHPITREIYRKQFTFPVQKYYEGIGWDFRKYSFKEVGFEFIIHYKQRLNECGLFPEAPEVLQWISDRGIKQHMLSAMESGLLKETTQKLGVSKWLTSIHGIRDNYAHGKLDAGREMISTEGIDIKNCIIIGDTLHDAEIARALGTQCILISKGHQSFERLLESGFPVVHHLKEVIEFVKPLAKV